MNDFKDRLKLLRKSLGLSQSEMAKKLGVARSRISEFESGKTKPRDSFLRLIAHTFGVNYEWLKYGKGEMFTSTPSSEIQMEIIKEIVKGLKKLENEFGIDIPPDLWAEAVEVIYEEVIKELNKGNKDREQAIKKGIGKIIKLAG